MVNFLLTVDVEGRPNKSIGYAPVDTIDVLLNDLGTVTTLFVTPDVVTKKPGVVDAWQNSGHTVGLHIHPARFNDNESDLLSSYELSDIETFVSSGCETFERTLGFTPDSFRAGKWEYSQKLLEALDNQGFEIDASLRPPEPTNPYTWKQITEVPMTVYSNPLITLGLRGYDIDSVPLHADGFLQSTVRAVPFYIITWLLERSQPEYLMISFHDYDVYDNRLRKSIQTYTRWLLTKTDPTTIESII